MKRLLPSLAALCVVTSFAITASAQAVQGRFRTVAVGHNQIVLNGTTAARTLDFNEQVIKGNGLLSFVVQGAFATAGNVGMECTVDSGVKDAAGNVVTGLLQDCDVNSGVCTSQNARWEKVVAGGGSTEQWIWRVNIAGTTEMSCVFDLAAATGADILQIATLTSVY